MNRFFDGMFMLLPGVMLFCAAGCHSYRYSAAVKSGITTPYDFGSYYVKTIKVDSSKSFLKGVKMDEVLQIAGENDAGKGSVGENMEKICLVLREDQADLGRMDGLQAMLYMFSFGALPITQKERIHITVYVFRENAGRHHDNFELAIERKKRFTPFGLWPFLPDAERSDEIFAVDNTVMEWKTREMNGVIGYAISSGLTNDFKIDNHN